MNARGRCRNSRRFNRPRGWLTAAVCALALGSAFAQEGAEPSGAHDKIGHGSAEPPAPRAPSPGGTMDHGAMQGGAPPPDARDPHAYAEGFDFGPMRPKMGDEDWFGLFLVDRLEQVDTGDGTAALYDVIAWYGGVYDRVWLRGDGERDAGQIAEARTELLWGRAIAPFWDMQLGVRVDSGVGPNREWLAVGVQGIAPYWFNLEAAAYVGESGRTALRLEAEYELLITQRLILQPRAEFNVYGTRDAEREQGAGLSSVDVGVRLRYEIRREFAPYLGIERTAKYGSTADLARAAGENANDTLIVAGVRLWF